LRVHGRHVADRPVKAHELVREQRRWGNGGKGGEAIVRNPADKPLLAHGQGHNPVLEDLPDTLERAAATAVLELQATLERAEATAMLELRATLERAEANTVLSPRPQKKPHDLVIVARVVERCVAVFVFRIGVRPPIQEELHQGRVTMPRREVKRCAPVLGNGIGACPALQEKLRHSHVLL
jgi:hypothetical protein